MAKDHSIAHFAYIDVLRGLAILGVIAIHSGHVDGLNSIAWAFFNYGQMGVQLFFVASAITLCLSASSRQEERVVYFYIRRFFRIAPMYYFGILFYFLWRSFVYVTPDPTPEEQYGLVNVLENLLFIHGFDPRNYNFVVPGGWSIAVEMAFYAAFPLIFGALGRLGLQRFAIVSFAAITAGILVQYIGYEVLLPKVLHRTDMSNDKFNFFYASIFNQFGVFLVGMMAFRFLKRPVPRPVLGLALILVLVSIWMQNDTSWDTGVDGAIYPVLTAIAFAIFAVFLSGFRRLDFPGVTFVTRVGRRSFSMYIMHFFFLDVFRALVQALPLQGAPWLAVGVILVLTTLASYLLAGLTCRVIEDPGIAAGSRLIRRLKGIPVAV